MDIAKLKEYVQGLALDLCDNESRIEDLKKELSFREATKADQMREYRASLSLLRMNDSLSKESAPTTPPQEGESKESQ